jgi:hypothetical protein
LSSSPAAPLVVPIAPLFEAGGLCDPTAEAGGG